MAISEKVKNALEGASWVRRMFEQGEELKKLYGEENIFDFSLGNPNLEPPASLQKALKARLDEGDEVIIPSPYFMEFKFYIENSGGRIRLVETHDDFSLNLEEIEKAFGKKTKAVLINSPNNPTGAIYNGESLEELGKLLKEKSRELKRTLYLITDAAYRRIVFDQVKLPIAFQFYPHTIRVTSHSKDLSLPGERIGYIAANPSCEEVEELIAAIA